MKRKLNASVFDTPAKKRRAVTPDAPRKQYTPISYKDRMKIVCLADDGLTPTEISREMNIDFKTAVTFMRVFSIMSSKLFH